MRLRPVVSKRLLATGFLFCVRRLSMWCIMTYVRRRRARFRSRQSCYCWKKGRSVPEMPVTAGVVVFLVSSLFAIPGAIAAALFVREREVPTFGRVC